MIFLTVLVLIAAASIAGTIVSISRDGYHRVPDRPSLRR